jgi:hypothetical protein
MLVDANLLLFLDWLAKELSRHAQHAFHQLRRNTVVGDVEESHLSTGMMNLLCHLLPRFRILHLFGIDKWADVNNRQRWRGGAWSCLFI